jgi:FAD/FMN-containing dehydrogenase
MSIAQEFSSTFSGTLIEPGAAEYDAACVVYSAVGAPAVVVRPANTADVVEAVTYAREHDLVLSVRSGGHSAAAHSTNTGGLVIDLRDMNSVEVLDGTLDPALAVPTALQPVPDAADTPLVRIGGGAVWGDIALALQPHGLALTSGDTVSVGVGGLTLGGGIGWMVRQHGLALDSLVSAEIVTAAGDIVHASADNEPELFWAIRGGGGNFGVVTSFTFQPHRLGGVVAGPIMYGPENIAGLLAGWRDAMRAAPEELNSTFLALPAFGEEMPAGVQILVCYAGADEEAAQAAIYPFMELGGVIAHDIRPKAYADVLEEAHPPPGVTIVNDNGLARELDDDLITTLAAAYRGMGAAALMIRSLGGAFSRVPSDATAFAHRDSEALIIAVTFMDPDTAAEGTANFDRLWATVAPLMVGSYGNFQARVDEKTIASMYPPATRERLIAAKRKYDPHNLFNQNHNVAP